MQSDEKKNTKDPQTEPDVLCSPRKKKIIIKTLKVSNTAQDAPNTTHCKTMSTCKRARITCNSKLLTKGALEIAPQQA